MMTDRILRRPEVEAVTGLARSTIYHRLRYGNFPVPVSLGVRCVGWRLSEIEAWLASLPPRGEEQTAFSPPMVGKPGMKADQPLAEQKR